MGHMIHLLVERHVYFGTVPDWAVPGKVTKSVPGEVTILLASKARSVVEGVLVCRWLVGSFWLSFAWQTLYQDQSRS